MKPITQITQAEARSLEGLFFDLDDTLLDHGQLTQEAYSALFRLRACGLQLIALTGRPASWGEIVARMWPVEGAIAENGAVAFERYNGQLRSVDLVPAKERALRATRLSALAEETRRRFPTLVPTDDVRGRVSDYTFDIGEHERVEEETIAEVRRFAQSRGARTTRSSVHLHMTFDSADKATGALGFVRHRGVDPTRARRTYAFIGDSDNDAAGFAAFSQSVGVRNLRGHFSIPPRYQTQNSASQGFCEYTSILCHLRQS
jgi:HAD superfamily hydrolase (TIGR01484 family)